MTNNPESNFESAIYEGTVRHRRFSPRSHNFDYPLFMFLLKVDEIPQVVKAFWQLSFRAFSWARFKRDDYIISDHEDIAEAVRAKLSEELNCQMEELGNEVFLLAHLRYFGLYFSPLNVYFVKKEGTCTHMLAEVSNTPWHEKHYYALDLNDLKQHPKEFHVSPFNPMEQTYQWIINPPNNYESPCVIHIESFSQKTNNKVFDATLRLRRKPLNNSALTRTLLRTPMQTLTVMMGIYWQALKLLLKRVPFYKHPSKL